ILGKLDVGTIDPAYTIGNTTYATYGHSTVGVKEEVVVNLVPTHFNTSVGSFEHIIDFDTLPETSDLWLFYQITDFGESWKNLVVSATAGFDGFVFYKKVPTENKLIIASTERGEIALRLIAPRFDSDKWGNVRPDQDGWKGFILNLKEKLN
ncbi:MAG: hypothetical protein HYT93_00005, partial [Parcubacteria group bacterium]|nr:hypothetical protein [Parcubacteria group bacterium]